MENQSVPRFFELKQIDHNKQPILSEGILYNSGSVNLGGVVNNLRVEYVPNLDFRDLVKLSF